LGHIEQKRGRYADFIEAFVRRVCGQCDYIKKDRGGDCQGAEVKPEVQIQKLACNQNRCDLTGNREPSECNKRAQADPVAATVAGEGCLF